MQAKRLKLKNFRCYDELDIDFDPELTVIVGENGKGKTAIFDAIAIAQKNKPRDAHFCRGMCGGRLFIMSRRSILKAWRAATRRK